MSTEEALDQFARAWLDGRAPDAGEFCAAHPECAVELRERIDGFLFVASGLFGSAEDPGAPGARLGDFQLLREIGRGGMGVVYEAEQVSLGRRVAVKVLAVHPAARPEQVERFRREAATAARLRHPGIVPIHSVGEENGARYFAMELVAGTPLDRLLERREAVGTQPGDVARSCRIAAEVADALEHAHRAGVLHRDVKPSNVIVREDGSAVLTDFGLARDEGLPGVTVTGEFAGTPHYVSPERARGGRTPVDARSDVYSLGVTLFECLTLRRPFEGDTAQEVLAKVAQREPPSPQRLNPRLAPDLATIVLKAIEKDPRRRYASAADFASDLRAFLAYRPISARRTPTTVRVVRWARREPWKAALAALLAAVVVAAAAFLPSYVSARAAERDAWIEDALADAYSRLGLGDAAGAVERFREIRAVDPASAEAAVGAAEALLQASRAGDALQLLDGLGPSLRDAPVVRRVRADALRAAGREEEASALAASLGPPVSPLELFVAAERQMRPGSGRKRHATAETVEFLERSIQASRRARAFAHFELALAAYAARDPRAARRAADAIEALWPDSSLARYWAAFAVQEADPPRSIAAYRRALELDPAALQARLDLGAVLQRTGDVDGAIAEFRDVLAGRPTPFLEAHADSSLGSALLRKGDRVGAEAALRKAVAASPTLADAHVNLGVCRREAGDLVEAMACFRKAVEIEPRDAGGWVNLGFVHQSRDERDEAIAAYRRAIDIEPREPIALQNLASLLGDAGELDEAIDLARRATDASPGDGRGHSLLGTLLAKDGREPEAVACFRRAIEVDPELPDGHHSLGVALFRRGALADAKLAFARAAELLPASFVCHRDLVRVLRDLGDEDGATAEIERFRSATASPASAPARR